MNWKYLLLTWLAWLCCLSGTAQNAINRFEYWTDKQFDQRKSVAATDGSAALELDLSAMEKGIHAISFRAIDTNGLASPTFHRTFLVSDVVDNGQPLITSYAYWFNNGVRHHVKVDPIAQLVVDTADIEMVGQIVPDSIDSSYQFDVAQQQISFVADVRVGLQVFNAAGVGSSAIVDTLRQHLVRIPLNAAALQADVNAAAPTPTGGHLLAYTYAPTAGDSLHLTIEGTARVDLFDADGHPIAYTALNAEDAPSPAWRSPETTPPTRTLAFTAATDKVYALLHSSEQMMEQTAVLLKVVVPSGVDSTTLSPSDALPPFIYTLSGLRISTNGRKLHQLDPGVYIVRGRKVVGRP